MSDDHRIVVSQGLWLAPLCADDRYACVKLLNDVDVSRWLLRVPHPYAESDFDQFLSIVESATAQFGHPCHYSIHHRTDGLIGGFGFEGLVEGHKLEIGYWLGKSFWGQGIMTEVVAAASEFAVSRWNVVRITAHVFEDNAASARILQKNGFENEGLLRKQHQQNERFINSRLYARVCD